MLEIMRRGQRWLLWLVILFVGGVFVFTFGIGGGFSGSSVSGAVAIDVDGRRYDYRDFDRVRRRQEAEYRRVLGDAFDSESAAGYINDLASNFLIRQAVLAREADQMGFRVSDAEVRDYLRAIPGAADDDGRIDREIVTAYAEREFGSVVRFESSLREEILARKTLRLLQQGVMVSDDEALDALRIQREEVRIAYLALDPSDYETGDEITEEAIDALLESDLARVQTAYDARADEFDRPEEVRARHILVRVDGSDDEARQQARGKADDLRTQLEGGADFAELARAESDDPGSKARGGDLGFFGRGRMVKPFEDAAFGTSEGELSEVVESVHGYHVILVEEKREARNVDFETAKREVASDLLQLDQGAIEARALADKLLETIRGGTDLVSAARERALSLERPDPLRRRPDGFVRGLGAAPELMRSAFALTDEAPTLDRILEVDGKLVLVQRLGGSLPSDDDLAAQVTETRQQLLLERRNQIADVWVETRRKSLAESGALVYNLSSLTR